MNRPDTGWSDRLARITVTGLLVNLLATLSLSVMACWTPTTDQTVWVALCAAGFIRHYHKTSKGIRPIVIRLVPSVLIIAILALIALWLPNRSEWLAGGWDPGIYPNNALAITARQGWLPNTDSIYASLSLQDRVLLSDAHEAPYHEIMPGIPLNLADGSLPLYFPPLSSIGGAWLTRIGGTFLMLRAPALFALLGLIPLLALFRQLGLSRVQQRVALAFVLVSPAWWYHQGIPTTEMLLWLLLLGALVFYQDAMRQRQAVPWLSVMCLFAATLNHFNTPVPAIVFLLLAAFCESELQCPKRLWRLASASLALLAGFAVGSHLAWVTVSRLQNKESALSLLLAWTLSGAVAAIVIATRQARTSKNVPWSRPALRRILQSIPALIAMLAVYTTLERYGLPGFPSFENLPVAGSLYLHARQLVAFYHLPWILLCLFGVGLLLRTDRHPPAPALSLVAFCLGACLLVFLLFPGITLTFPWALRRTVVIAVPLMALASAAALDESYLMRIQRWKALLVLGLGILAFAGGAASSLRAIRVSDYAGLSAVMESLAGHTQKGDLIVVDDFRWGTPLLLTYGLDVINGQHLQSLEGKTLDALMDRVQKSQHGRILWLTSQPDSLTTVPGTPGKIRTISPPIPYEYRTVLHHPRQTRFQTQTRRSVFTLHAWHPEMPSSISTVRPGPHRLIVQSDTPVSLRWGDQSLDALFPENRWTVMDLPELPPSERANLRWNDAATPAPPMVLLAAGDPLILRAWHGNLYPQGSPTPDARDHEQPIPEFPLPFAKGASAMIIHVDAATPPSTAQTLRFECNYQQSFLTLSPHQATQQTYSKGPLSPTLTLDIPEALRATRLSLHLQPLYTELECIALQDGIHLFATYQTGGTPDASIARFLKAGYTQSIIAGDNRYVGAYLQTIAPDEAYSSDLQDSALMTFHNFHDREDTGQSHPAYQRWTAGSTATLRIAADPAVDMTVHLRLREPPAAVLDSGVFIDIGSRRLPVVFEDGLWEKSIKLTAAERRDAFDNDVMLRVQANPWSPSKVMRSADTRTLGVLLEGAGVTFHAPQLEP